MYTRIGGSWKNVVEGYTRIAGAWKPFFTSGPAPLSVDFLVIAGGGGTGSNATATNNTGAGGAGGYRTSFGTSGGGAAAESRPTIAVGTSYTVTVGAGGALASGSNSVFSTITSIGGGRAGLASGAGTSGGSGGGGGFNTQSGGAGTTGQGFAGGSSGSSSSPFGTGGGGGAGSVGGNKTGGGTAGVGGTGVVSTITGSSVERAGGGSGSDESNGTRAAATGGGGRGQTVNGTTSESGTANTGGGGGACGGGAGAVGGNGGSGVVILRYSNAYAISVGAGLTATTTTVGTDNVTTFTAGTGSITFAPTVQVDYLVIAGGGGTTFGLGGGGGAGGYRTSAGPSGGGAAAESKANVALNTNFTVTVGAGGAGEVSSNQNFGGQGSNSVFGSITSLGGGKGTGQSITFPNVPPGQPGGSGSGGVRNSNNPGAGTAGQGFSGGFGNNNANAFGGGGGGGAGAVGGNGSATIGGAGGAGVASSITGTSVIRAGGGGGCVNEGSIALGGSGGGGNGAVSAPSQINATAGAVNTGGGGGGGADFAGRAGGSGVVILSYPSTYALNIGAGLTATTTTVGANKVTTFTAGTGSVSLVDPNAPIVSDFVLLETINLTGTASSITFSGLSAYASQYKHLQIRTVFARSTGGLDGVTMRYNGDSGANYAEHLLYGNGSSVLSAAATNATFVSIGLGPVSTSSFGASVIDILDAFSTSKNKTNRVSTGALSVGEPPFVQIRSGHWRSNSAISSITLAPFSSTFNANSRFSIYGVK